MVQTKKIIINIKELYYLALIEKEGLGTAYEYFVKLKLILKKINNKKIKNVLIYGLPEKYGYSLDFLYIANIMNWNVCVFDDSNKKVNKLKKIIDLINYKKKLLKKPKFIKNINKKYDLCFSCEYLQQFKKKEILNKISIIKNNSKNSFIFVPNESNKLHLKYSKLNGLNINFFKKNINNYHDLNFIDCPPFPPGIKKKEKIGFKKGIYIIKIIYYFEKILLKVIKKRLSHIIYVHF